MSNQEKLPGLPEVSTPNLVANTSNPPAGVPRPPPSVPVVSGSDIIAQVIGDFGIWQLRTILIIFLCKIPAAWFMACIIFTGPELMPGSEFQCDTSDVEGNFNVTNDQCYIAQTSSTSNDYQVSECKKFNYDYDFYSLIMQYDLVCLREIFVAWTQFWHLFGVLVGGFTATKMMICISPRYVYLIGMIAQIVCGVVTGYSPDFSMHCAFRCMSAVCCAIMFTAGQAIFADITSGIYRVGAIILYDTFWSIGVIFLPGLAWFFKSWAHIYLGITFPTVILMLLLNWTPESPRWLLKNGDKNSIYYVERTIRNGAAINLRTDKIPPNFLDELEKLREELRSAPPPAKWIDLWKGKRAKTHMFAAHIALSFFIINFMGMLLNIRSFGRDYLVPNTILMGFSEIIGCFLALHFTLVYNKWKWQCAGVFNILAGLLGCCGWFFSNNDSMNPTIKVILWMILATISKSGVSCAQSMILACMNEVMPPNKKVPYVFSVVTWARVWLLSAPFFNVLKKFDTALSLTSYCVMSILGGFFTCLMLTPRPGMQNIRSRSEVATKMEQSPLNVAVWTVETDVNNTRL